MRTLLLRQTEDIFTALQQSLYVGFLFQGRATVTIFPFHKGAAAPSGYRPLLLKVIAVTAFTCTGRDKQDLERHPGDSA
jgi:hypothetical protein